MDPKAAASRIHITGKHALDVQTARYMRANKETHKQQAP